MSEFSSSEVVKPETREEKKQKGPNPIMRLFHEDYLPAGVDLATVQFGGRVHNEKLYLDFIQNHNHKEKMKQHWHMTETDVSMSSSGKKRPSYMDIMYLDESWPDDWPDNWPIVEEEEEEEEKKERVVGDKEEVEDSFCLDVQWHPKFSSYDPSDGVLAPHTWQLYSLKLTRELLLGEEEEEEGDSFQVYGLLYLYSRVGNAYQVIFDLPRDDCQTLTKEDPYLLLTGPNVPPLGPPNRLLIEGTLKLKSTTQSEDKFLSVSICCEHGKVAYKNKMEECELFDNNHPTKVCLQQATGKRYLLEMTRGVVIYSAVATISVRVVCGLLPACRFTAFTASLRDLPILLVDSRDGNNVTSKHGLVELSRRTLAVELCGSLIVCVELGCGKTKEFIFSNDEFGEFHHREAESQEAEIGSCEIRVRVRWSKYYSILFGC